MSKESLGIKAGRAALWQIAGGGWQTLVRLGASVYLARALKPSDFGLFGMALLYQELLVTALSMGFGTGLIVKKKLSQEDLSTAFWLSFTVRTLIFLAVFLTAPLAAVFWKEPKVELVIRVMSLTLLIQIIGIVPGTLATKNLEFKKINIIRALAILLESLTAIILVSFTSLTYWALVIGMIINTLIYNLGLWFFMGYWLPQFVIHRDIFRYLFRFGFYNWLFSIANYLHQNIDYFLVGRLLNATYLGFYEFAYRIPHLVSERIAKPIGNVIFPALSKVQDDHNRLLFYYTQAIQYIISLVLPILGTMFVLAEPIVMALWGKKWLPIVTPLRILCVCAFIRCLMHPVGFIFLCKNRPDLHFKFSFLRLIFTFTLVYSLGRLYGINGVACGMLLSTLPSFYILNYALKMVDSSIKIIFSVLKVPVFFSGIYVFLLFLVKTMLGFCEYSIYITLSVSVCIAILSYFLLLYILLPDKIKEFCVSIACLFGFSRYRC